MHHSYLMTIIGRMRTNMRTTNDLSKFKGYDLVLAQCHLDNFGVIYMDNDYDEPMEIEDVIAQGIQEA